MADPASHISSVEPPKGSPDAARQSTASLRPGERMVAGSPYVFDATLLGQHCAREAVLNAPADLSRLTREALIALSYHATSVIWAKDDPRVHPQREALQTIPMTAELLAKAEAVLIQRSQADFAERERAALAAVEAA